MGNSFYKNNTQYTELAEQGTLLAQVVALEAAAQASEDAAVAAQAAAEAAAAVAVAGATPIVTAAFAARTVTAGAGLTGGGDLSANRTFDVGAGTGITVAADSVGLSNASSLTIKSNITGGAAPPVDNTLSAIIDAAVTSARGSILYRGASGWTSLLGTSGYLLKSNGSGADPVFTFAREVLAADRTYYVRTDGSDSNNGLANTSGGAFLTIQKAIDTVANTIDLNKYSVVIQVADGTYTTVITSNRPWTGTGTVTLQGNLVTPANALLNVTGDLLSVSNGCRLAFQGFKVRATGTCVFPTNGAVVNMASMDFGVSGSHMQLAFGAQIFITGANTISGSAASHIHNTQNSYLNIGAGTWTLTGTPAFATFFFGTSETSTSIFACTYSGAATGTRCFIHQMTLVETSSTSLDPNTFFPGNVNGPFNGLASYNECTPLHYTLPFDKASSGTPATGIAHMFVDTTSKGLGNKDDAGVWHTTVVPQAAVARKVVTEITSAGVVTLVDKSNTSLVVKVNRSTAQTPTVGAWVKVQLNTEVADPNGWFDSATNFRLQPTVACVLSVVGSIQTAVGTGSYGGISIYKNGTEYNKFILPSTVNDAMQLSVPALVEFNGTTDYIELFGFSSGGTPSFSGGANVVKLDAYQLY